MPQTQTLVLAAARTCRVGEADDIASAGHDGIIVGLRGSACIVLDVKAGKVLDKLVHAHYERMKGTV